MSDKALLSLEDCLKHLCDILEDNFNHDSLHLARNYIWFLSRCFFTDDFCNLVHQYPHFLIF